MTTSQPLTSIVIATYNAEPYLKKTIESILLQEGVSLELIIVDDASTDRTWQIIEEMSDPLSQKGIELKVIRHHERQGLRRIEYNYDEGVMASSGKYFKILDQDDWLASPDSISVALDIMERDEKIGSVIAPCYFHDDTGRASLRNPIPFKDGKAINRTYGLLACLFSPIVVSYHGSNLVRRSAWDDLRNRKIAYPDRGLFENPLTLALIYDKGWDVGFTAKPVFYYRIHRDSVTAKGGLRSEWRASKVREIDAIVTNPLLRISAKIWGYLVQTGKHYYQTVLHSRRLGF